MYGNYIAYAYRKSINLIVIFDQKILYMDIL
jgi:hypothetical protein